jgi:hypothetical protein
MSFDLTIRKCGAGPGNSQYVFNGPGAQVVVQDASYMVSPPGVIPAVWNQAILIYFGGAAWLYEFVSGQYPPQEPKLLLSSNNTLSIEGAGQVIQVYPPP